MICCRRRHPTLLLRRRRPTYASSPGGGEIYRPAPIFAAVGAAAAVAALVLTAPVDAFYEAGIASIYGPNDSGGQFGPTGQRINHAAFAAAHKTLPLGTLVEVVNKRTGRSAVVKITDRGPYVRGRIIDLTPKSAAALGVDELEPVRIGVVPDRLHLRRTIHRLGGR